MTEDIITPTDHRLKPNPVGTVISGFFHVAIKGRSGMRYTTFSEKNHRGWRGQVNRRHGWEGSRTLCQSKRASSRTFRSWSMWCPSSVSTSSTVWHKVRKRSLRGRTEQKERGGDCFLESKVSEWIRVQTGVDTGGWKRVHQQRRAGHVRDGPPTGWTDLTFVELQLSKRWNYGAEEWKGTVNL